MKLVPDQAEVRTQQAEWAKKLNQLEEHADDNRFDQAQEVVRLRDQGKSQQEIADNWKKRNGESYKQPFVSLVEKIGRNIKKLISRGLTWTEAMEWASGRGSLDPLMSSAKGEWNTPPEIVERVEQVLGTIDLDPCSNDGKPNVPAIKVYRKKDDGLSRSWTGRVYMNPPYGRGIDEWVQKLDAEFIAGNVTEAIALVPARTDTDWFEEFRDYGICLLHGRLKFGDAENSAPFPSALVYLGDNLAGFAKVFEDLGDTFRRYIP